ncbi:hypothetical protein CYD53_12131 [Bosea psychrotolerans]|uniref:Uncharacterized protein n=1 Tax=Bosea psychrotolerans TaxID=1871628 RepID=A0A2S4LWW7_9HYPH|nr:hypothetical protein CYD53_12131 [Bosea psychrotolerans]
MTLSIRSEPRIRPKDVRYKALGPDHTDLPRILAMPNGRS